jgi:ligand-binding sensor domain-containing protein
LKLAHLIGIFSTACIHAWAQPVQISFERFNDTHGLPNNQVVYSIQDRDGIIWIAGADGLSSYDGYRVKILRHNSSDTTTISGNNLVSLFEDSRRRLWVGTLGMGVNVSDPQKRQFRKVLPANDTTGLFSFTVRSILEDHVGNFWLAGNTGLHILTESEQGFVLKSLSEITGMDTPCDGLSRATALYKDDAHRIWIGTEKGLAMYDPSGADLLCPDAFPGIPARTVHDISQDREGRLWVTCQNRGPRLYYTAGDTLTFHPFTGIPIRSEAQGIQIAFDFDNRLWAAVFGERAYAYDFADSCLFLTDNAANPIANERFIRRPLVDHSGNVWLHSEGFVIYKYPTGFHNYLHPFAFHQSNSCIYSTRDHFWIGYREEGAVRFDRHSGVTELFASQHTGQRYLPSDLVADIKEVSSGNLILAGFDTIVVMHPEGMIRHKHYLGGTNRAIFEDSQQRIWIGSIQGLILFSEDDGILRRYGLPPLHGDTRNFVQAIDEDIHGNLWMATAIKGLVYLDHSADTLRQFLPVSGDPLALPTASILDLTFDKSRQVLWIASDAGLVRFDITSLKAKTYTTAHGLVNDYISALTFDQKGNLWVSTHSGIAVFDPQRETFVNYSAGHGLLNLSYYDRSAHLSADGTVYFGGSKGIDYFHPAKLRPNPFPPKMYLTDFIIGNTRALSAVDIAAAGGVALSYRDNLIQIGFAGLHYSAPERIRYQYRMDGVHKDWIALGGQHQVIFSDLKPADYVFRARAQTIDGIWSEADLAIPISVATPFWATWWFRLLMAGVIAAAIYVYVRMRESAMRRKQQEEARIQRKITELEKRALQAQMNPHFIYNSMNSIQQFMIARDFEGAIRYLTRFSRLLRTVLNMAAQNRIALSDEIKLIEDYIELEGMRFPDKFTYSIEVAPDVNIHAAEIPPFFIQPQVENAIRHGLLRKPTPGHLRIAITTHGESLRILVEDDGIGREAALALKHRDGMVQESKGLAIVKERLSHLRPENGFQPFVITDLYDDAQRAAGTRVEITLPLE